MDRITTMARWNGALCVFALTLSTLGLHAEVKLPSLIADGMVLQQGMRVPIWGTADPLEWVRVTFDDQQVTATADRQGQWSVKIGPLNAGGPFTMTIVGKNSIKLHDVLVGEVWVCSGQSNMEMWVGPGEPETGWRTTGVANYQDELAHADFPMLHLFTVEKAVAGRPQREVKGFWAAAYPQTVNDFSAVGYFFGRELLKSLKVPIGMIHSSWGGSEAETWTSRGMLASDPEFQSTLDDDRKLFESYPKKLQEFEQRFAQWKQASANAESEGRPVPSTPAVPDDPRQSRHRPAGLYNAMLAPLSLYAIKGAIWYQGEANINRPAQYRKLFPAMIRDWRHAWGEGDFPFLFVQLPNRGPERNLPQFREAQSMALSLANTGMAVTIDTGDATDTHPKNKQDVGYRLALVAQSIAYGQDVIYSGPIYESMTVYDENIRVRFKRVHGGLIAKGTPASPLGGFEIAADDHKFVSADARIEGEMLVVHSEEVKHPVAVRYGWGMKAATYNLYNSAGLPASPFRTDDWTDSAPGR